MFNQILRQIWGQALLRSDIQRSVLRGATKFSPRVSFISRLKVLSGYAKLALGFLVTIFVLLSAYSLANNMWSYFNQPISKVLIKGELNYIDTESLEKRLEPIVSTGFLSLDLERLRLNLEKAPWISNVEIERVWPDQININLFTKHPIARWGEKGLLNNTGDAFVTKYTEKYNFLPKLSGPDYAQQQVMQQYQMLSHLLRPMELSIASLTLNDRGSWSLTTNSDLELKLGGDDLLNKIKRFAKAYNTELKDKMFNIQCIDLRYPNGLAVVWRNPSLEISTKIMAKH